MVIRLIIIWCSSVGTICQKGRVTKSFKKWFNYFLHCGRKRIFYWLMQISSCCLISLKRTPRFRAWRTIIMLRLFNCTAIMFQDSFCCLISLKRTPRFRVWRTIIMLRLFNCTAIMFQDGFCCVWHVFRASFIIFE